MADDETPVDPFLLVTPEDVAERLEWELDEDEHRLLLGTLEGLSDDARFYGSLAWTADSTPRQVKSLIIRAASRFMRNPDNYTVSRAGDETVNWSDRDGAGYSPEFSEREQKMLRQISGSKPGLFSVNVVNYVRDERAALELVPVEGGGDPFPWTDRF